jgi:signal transduction histidine kinase
MFVNGEITGMFSIGRNITTRKRDERKIKELNSKLVEANRIISIERERAKNKITLLEELNQLKSEFISNISHELRTPLASIVGFAETINSDPDLPKEMMNEFTNIILSEGKRLAKLINDVLDFSKLESGEEELKIVNVDINDLLNEIIDSLEPSIEEKKLSITKSLPEEDLVIKADKDRISKVIYNLLSNAIKFTNSGGRISVLAQDFGKEIEIAISDTGIGIPEKEIPKLFQKFSKVNRPGTQITGAGFGLTAVKQIVELHKGLIKVKSEVNKGSTFIVRLPK